LGVAALVAGTAALFSGFAMLFGRSKPETGPSAKIGTSSAEPSQPLKTAQQAKPAKAARKPQKRIRLEPNTTYEEGGYRFQTDAMGRIKAASGQLKPDPAKARNPYAQRVVGGADRLDTDVGGHLIANRFGGPGDYKNLVPLDANLNNGAWKQMENGWAKARQQGKIVEVDVRPVYEGSSVRPSKIYVAWTEDGEPYGRVFDNKPGG
jgi:hypothetical protein